MPTYFYYFIWWWSARSSDVSGDLGHMILIVAKPEFSCLLVTSRHRDQLLFFSSLPSFVVIYLHAHTGALNW